MQMQNLRRLKYISGRNACYEKQDFDFYSILRQELCEILISVFAQRRIDILQNTNIPGEHIFKQPWVGLHDSILIDLPASAIDDSAIDQDALHPLCVNRFARHSKLNTT